MTKLIEIKNLNKSYYSLSGEIKALDNINFDINEGEFVSIVGRSGCGKSTLLNILAGIDNDYDGKVVVKKDFGYMLQQDALLPWLTIYDNVTLYKKLKFNIDLDYVNKLLKRYNLDDFKNKKPDSISGGMRKRCAIIRTLSTKPSLLLLDEPFSALDYQTRLLIENDVYNIVKENKMSAIIVTHDIEEAVSLSDKVIVLSNRPAKIKNIYNIELENKDNPINNRYDKKFNYYVDLIMKELEIDV